jgi:CheY-like chemotaxis protein/predicted kinase
VVPGLGGAKRRLILIGGHPYSGKVALAAGLARASGAYLIRWEDTPRGEPAAERYRVLSELTREALGRRPLVAAVAPLWRPEVRVQLLELAAELSARPAYVECTAAPLTIKRRIFSQFASAPSDFLELRAARALGQRAGYQPAGEELGGCQLVRITCEQGPIGKQVEQVRRALELSPRANTASDERPRRRGPRPGRRPLVLVVDDDTDLLDTLREVLETAGCEVACVASADDALAWAAASPRAPTLVLLDFAMPGKSGLELAPALQQRWPSASLVMLSAHGDPWLCDDAFRERFCEFLLKPVRAADLLRVLDEAASGEPR